MRMHLQIDRQVEEEVGVEVLEKRNQSDMVEISKCHYFEIIKAKL